MLSNRYLTVTLSIPFTCYRAASLIDKSQTKGNPAMAPVKTRTSPDSQATPEAVPVTPEAVPVTPEAVPVTDPFDALSDVQTVEAKTDVPDKIKAFVEAGLKRTEEAPRKWQQVALPTEEDAKKVLRHARRYAATVGYTFRVDKAHAPSARHLMYRVTRKVQREAELWTP